MKDISMKRYVIAVVGMGYVGLSIATLLSQNNKVYAVDIISKKNDAINKRQSPIKDKEIEEYLANKELDLNATLDVEYAYKEADFVVGAAPINYDSCRNFFDTSAVDAIVEKIIGVNPKAIIVIKSTVPVGYTEALRTKTGHRNIIFSPEFLRETKALYDNLYPSRIIVGADLQDEYLVDAAELFAQLLKGGVSGTILLFLL